MAVEAVVFVPGICGSVLKHGDTTIWPGSPGNTVFHNYPDEYVELLATSDALAATDVLRSVPLSVLGVTVHHFDGYRRALELIEQLGFRERGGTLIPFAYDWRRDIRTSAQALRDRLAADEFIGRTIAIVAHSMGGLVTRYMLERLGAPAGVTIELCVLVAVPHLGAPVVVQNILGLRPEIFLSSRQCKVALCNDKYPSAYQLLPRLGVPALLEATAQGFDIRDPYEQKVWERLSMTAAGIAAARQLGEDLPYIGPGFRPPCRYVAIAGNAQKTTTANYVEGGLAHAREEATAGDGTVPLWSAAPPGIPVRYVSSTHGGMFRDDDCAGLIRAVLRPGTPGGRLFDLAPGDERPVLAPQAVEPSVEVGAPFTIAIVADRPTTAIDATLLIDRQFATHADSQTVPIRYAGGAVRSLPIDLPPVAEPAVLRFRLQVADGQAAGAESSVLIVNP